MAERLVAVSLQLCFLVFLLCSVPPLPVNVASVLTPLSAHCLVGLVVKVSTSRVEDLGFQSRLRWDFSGSSHTGDFKIGTPVATLPGTWRYRVSAETGWPGVSTLTGWDVNFDLQLLSRCGSMYNCLSRSVPEIHWHVAGMLSNLPINQSTVSADSGSPAIMSTTAGFAGLQVSGQVLCQTQCQTQSTLTWGRFQHGDIFWSIFWLRWTFWCVFPWAPLAQYDLGMKKQRDGVG